MKRQKKRLHNRVTVIAAVVVVAATALGYATWFAYHSSQVAEASLKSANKVSSDIPKLPQITTFDACKTAHGSKLLQTYPEQCVTVTGKKFVDNPKYLVIKEWGVKLPLSANITDAYYYIRPGFPSGAYFSPSSLKTTDCRANDISLAGISRVKASDIDETTGKTVVSEHPDAVKVGNHYYVPDYPQAGCDASPAHIPQNVDLRSEFSSAMRRIQTE